MSGRSPYEDELAMRRSHRRSDSDEPGGADGDNLPPLSWKDIFALTIAAYQVLLPIVAAMAGVLIVVYLLFRFIFS